MPLTLVTGPAGSGKTGEVLERFAAALERQPVLVVPTLADIERYEDELLARRPVALGGRVVTFERLFELVASAAGLAAKPRLTRAQRRALVAAAVGDVGLDALAESARRRGFADALDRLLADCQSALISPADLRSRLATVGQGARRRHLQELAELYAAYAARRDRLGRADAHSLAAETVAAVTADPAPWGARPVLVHGFDDLTPAQLALIAALGRDAEVTVSVLHEPGRAALAARGRLVAALEDMAGPAKPAQLSLADDSGETAGSPGPISVALPARPASSVLAHVERSLFADAPSRTAEVDGLRLLAAAGVRNEAEQVAAAVARLLRTGVRPESVAVVARSLDASAGLLEEVLDSFGVPATIHADRPLAETAVGRGLAAAARAALAPRAASDVVAFLRTGPQAAGRRVDELERAVRVERLESAEEALARWEELGGRSLWEIETLRASRDEPPALLHQAAAVARELAERPHSRRADEFSTGERAELAAAEAVARTFAELAELEEDAAALVDGGEALVTLVEGLRVPRGPADAAGRVEVMTPYRVRARQFAHVFVLSLQEGEFPRRRREDAFLTEPERQAAGLPARGDQRDEERYLFYICATRATRVLWLSFRTADDEGRAAGRSFFVDEVLDLLEPGAEAAVTETRRLFDTVLAPSQAPTEVELGRALAEGRATALPDSLGASEHLRACLEPRLRAARERADRLPGRLRVPHVRDQFAAKSSIGASSLELQAECSFRYFVQHELEPRELAPGAEPITRGAITHRVLERLYQGGRPDADAVEEALERARAILAEEARDTSLDPRRPGSRPAYRRIESDVARFIRYDAQHGQGRVARVEAGFGGREDDERPGLDLSGFELHGKIDRIDVLDGGLALIRDYKTAAKVPTRKELVEERKLQLPLYMLAVRELWGLEPIGGVYHPLGKQYDGVPRGLLRGPAESSPLTERFVSRDFTADEEEFEATLAAAREEAERLGARIHAGHLDRDPLGGRCPRYCDFHPICRRERGEKNPEENGASIEEEEGG